MLLLFRALQTHAALRGDGLLPEFLGPEIKPRKLPDPANENAPAEVQQPGPEIRKRSI